MPLSVTWDIMDGGEIAAHVRSGGRIVRVGHVRGITSTSTTAPTALPDILAFAPAYGEPYPDPRYSSFVVVYVTARGIPGTRGTMARLYVHYESPRLAGAAPIESFAIEDVTTLVAEPTQVIPGTLTPMLVNLETDEPDPDADPQPATVKMVTATYPRTYRAVVLYGLFNTRPSTTIRYAANCVNHSTWEGLPRGYWRCEGPRVRYSNRDGLFAVSVGFLSKGDQPGEDWSTYSFARDDLGEYVKPTETLMNTLKAQDYEFGKRWSTRGVYKAGLYRTANFSAIFGDTFVGG